MAKKEGEPNSLTMTGWLATACRANGQIVAQLGFTSYDAAVKWGNAMGKVTGVAYVLLFEGVKF